MLQNRVDHQPQTTQQGGDEGQHHWIRPTEGIIKINCDAACNGGTGDGGIGVLARNHEGRIVGGTQCAKWTASIEILEARYVYEGVKLVIENKWWRKYFRARILLIIVRD